MGGKAQPREYSQRCNELAQRQGPEIPGEHSVKYVTVEPQRCTPEMNTK